MFDEFKQLGFTDKEIKVYLCLSMLGKGNVQQICRQTTISRTSIYSVLKRLVEKGLVSEVAQEKGERQVEHFVPNKPSALFNFLQREHAALAEKESVARQLVAQIAPHFYPKIGYQSGREQVQKNLRDFFNEIALAAATDEASQLLIYESREFNHAYLACLMPLLTKSSLPTRLLLAEDIQIDDIAHLNHVMIRQLPNKLAPVTTLFCYAQTVMFVVCQPGIQLYDTFLIKDEIIAQDCQRLLQGLWERAHSANMTEPA